MLQSCEGLTYGVCIASTLAQKRYWKNIFPADLVCVSSSCKRFIVREKTKLLNKLITKHNLQFKLFDLLALFFRHLKRSHYSVL